MSGVAGSHSFTSPVGAAVDAIEAPSLSSSIGADDAVAGAMVVQDSSAGPVLASIFSEVSLSLLRPPSSLLNHSDPYSQIITRVDTRRRADAQTPYRILISAGFGLDRFILFTDAMVL